MSTYAISDTHPNHRQTEKNLITLQKRWNSLSKKLPEILDRFCPLNEEGDTILMDRIKMQIHLQQQTATIESNLQNMRKLANSDERLDQEKHNALYRDIWDRCTTLELACSRPK